MPIDLFAVSFRERGAEEPVVFLQDGRVAAVAQPMKEHGGTLDVGEEKGHRPGRQSRHVRPPGGARGAPAISDVRRGLPAFLEGQSLRCGRPPQRHCEMPRIIGPQHQPIRGAGGGDRGIDKSNVIPP